MAHQAWRRARWSAVVLLVASATAACSGGDGGGGSAATTTSTLSFRERDALGRLGTAATGMSLVASELSVRAIRGGDAEYCRTEAPAELAPHRTTLEAASDEEVRRRAGAALADLDAVVEACADGAGQASVQKALAGYNASFTRLRQRIDQLVGTGS